MVCEDLNATRRALYGFAPFATYWKHARFEKTGEFALLADLWKDKDPEFSSQMQWMFRQQGSDPLKHPRLFQIQAAIS